MKTFGISSRSNEDYLNRTQMNSSSGTPPTPVLEANIVMGGAMVTGIIVAIIFFCCYCHKTNRKPSPSMSSMIWRDPDLPLQIYTVEAAQNRLVEMEDYSERDVPQCPTPGPPPPYDTVIMSDRKGATTVKSDSSGLPSYEAALHSLDKHSPVHWTQYA